MGQRKIEFRGKTLSGEWVKGLLAKTKDGYFISNSAGRPFAYAIRPETVGQNTGLKDKNGVDVFEGDIIKMGGGGIVAVEYKDGGFGFQSYMVSGEFIGFAGHQHFDNVISKIEIIGNTIDNPELLKQ